MSFIIRFSNNSASSMNFASADECRLYCLHMGARMAYVENKSVQEGGIVYVDPSKY
jgi:hypothetical protein